MTHGRRAMLYATGFVALWAMLEALAARELVAHSPYQVVWTRYVVHLALMVAVWGWRDPGSLWRTRRPAFQFGRSLLMLAMPASWIIALQHGVAPSTVLAVFWVSPLLILALAAVVLRERVPWPVWTATAVGYVAVVIVLGPLDVSTGKAVLLPAAAAASFSLYAIMTRSLRSEPVQANLFYTALGVALALTPVMLWTFAPPTPRALAVMAGVGVLGFAALYGLDRMAAAPVSTAAPVLYLQLVFTAGFETVGHHSRPGRGALAALAVIAAVAVVMWLREPTLSKQGAV